MSDEKLKNPFRGLLNKVMEQFAERQWESLLRSHVLAMRPERKARLRTIIELSCELEKIRAVSTQATAFHEQIIEAIIEGNWKEAAEIDRMMLTGETYLPEQAEKYQKLWENFRATLLAACAEAVRRDANPDQEHRPD